MLTERSLRTRSVLGRGMVSFHLHNNIYSHFTDHETEAPVVWHLSTATQLICFLNPQRCTQDPCFSSTAPGSWGKYMAGNSLVGASPIAASVQPPASSQAPVTCSWHLACGGIRWATERFPMHEAPRRPQGVGHCPAQKASTWVINNSAFY